MDKEEQFYQALEAVFTGAKWWSRRVYQFAEN